MTPSTNTLASFSPEDINVMLQNLDSFSDTEVAEIYKLAEELEERQYVERCHNDLLDFTIHMDGKYITGKHHKILSNKLQKIESGEVTRLCVNIAPRHGKSHLVSTMYPAWFLGRNPSAQVMLVSHTADLAVDFGRKVRDLISSADFQRVFPGVSLSKDNKSAGRWTTSMGGVFFACGIGAKLAGRGADLLLIDDPHALEVSTPIPTPNGFVEIQDLKVGDYVFGPDGKPTKVIAKSDVWHDRELYSARTSDGEEILCDAKHLWGVNSDTNLNKAKVYNFNAEYISNWPKVNRPVLPKHRPVEYAERDLPIDPWVLGAWLGDGTASSGRITADPKNGDQAFMVEEFRKAGYKVGGFTQDGWSFTVYGLMPQLRALGVLNDKHVPEQYLTSSVEQRMALLQGLMDTDGSVVASSQAGFYNTNIKLVQACTEILHSLGVRAQMRSYEDTRGRWTTTKTNYRVMFRLADCVRMPRKLKYTRTPADKRSRSIEIENTQQLGSVQCITVDREDGLFLAGRGYVVTHNSEQDILNGNYDVFEKAYSWFAYGARTRLMPGGRIAIVQTRWSLDDLTGRVVKDMQMNPKTDQYEVIEFPAILNEGEKNEKALWPEFFDLDALKQIKEGMPTFQWNAQYQQDPTSEEGAIVKREWWRVWKKENPPPCEYLIMSLDSAAETNNRADFSALTTWGVFLNEEESRYEIILLNSIKERYEFPELKDRAYTEWQFWEPDCFIVEKKSSGVALYQEMRRTGIPVQEFTPHRGTGDKMARLNSVADIIRSGMVWVPETRWAEELVDEVAAFPAAPNDDLVDSCVMALMRFRSGGFIRLPSDEPDEEKYFKSKRGGYY